MHLVADPTDRDTPVPVEIEPNACARCGCLDLDDDRFCPLCGAVTIDERTFVAA
jgi:predicted Zn-ribbon and HTH transcriptional regulator